MKTAAVLTGFLLTGLPLSAAVVDTVDNNSTAGDGKTSLLEALTNISDNGTISFNIPGPGPHRIVTPAAGYPVITKNQVTIDGERKVWWHYADSGRWLDNFFCPVCGNTVYTMGEVGPEIGISVGCFADSDFPPPKRIYWASRRHHWLRLPPDAKIIDTQPA